RELDASAIGGSENVAVVCRPRVAFLPTGSELVPVGSELKRGQNFDTNSILVGQLLREMGAEAILHPIVKDDRESLRAAIEELLPLCDILLVNAGTS
ncbi:MAG: molybdopterin molybdenumtransferase MoeA, partial [Lachnospiraceae bacterium]|nr:molybdopterin molybdenumtransferase MoeA [Lachnospiraceae bacterium]